MVTLLLRTLQPPKHRNATGLGCSDFARHYFRNRGFFLFLQVLRWFTSLSSLQPAYVFSGWFPRFAREGFPIRKSPVITPVCGLPKLIAACHVLHRLSLPRHPPCALSSLTIELTPAQGAASLRSLVKITLVIRLEEQPYTLTHAVAASPKDTLHTEHLPPLRSCCNFWLCARPCIHTPLETCSIMVRLAAAGSISRCVTQSISLSKIVDPPSYWVDRALRP